MRLLLVMPTGLQVGYDEYFSSSPLGIETLAAHARTCADVEVADMRGRGHDVEAHADELAARKPDIVGVSVNSAPHMKYAMALGAALRLRLPGALLIAGGQQATFLADEILAPGDYNAVVRGEGEYALTEILTGGTFKGIAGVSWRDNGTVHHEPDRPLIADIDSVLAPARDLLPDRSKYRMGAYRVEGIETSRGCPYHCSFCSIRNFHRGKWRPKSVERTMRDIDEVLERYPERKVIYFADDNFANDIRRVEAICKGIIERRTPAYFWCQARVDRLAANPDVIELMGKAKFAAVLVGLETPVTRLLKSARKGISPEQIHKAIELLHAQDIGVWGTFTLGLPGETAEETRATADFIPTIPVDVAQITVATPIPGSTLYDEAKAGDQLLVTDWDAYDFTSPTMKGQLSKSELDAHMHRAYLKTYLSWRFFKSMFSQKSNINRLRRTAFGVFWAWIWFLIKDGVRKVFRRKPKARKNRESRIANCELGPGRE